MPRLDCHGGQVDTKGTLFYRSLAPRVQHQLRHTSDLVVKMSLEVSTCVRTPISLGDDFGSAG